MITHKHTPLNGQCHKLAHTLNGSTRFIKRWFQNRFHSWSCNFNRSYNIDQQRGKSVSLICIHSQSSLSTRPHTPTSPPTPAHTHTHTHTPTHTRTPTHTHTPTHSVSLGRLHHGTSDQADFPEFNCNALYSLC